jgi:hypothetical protein
VEISICKLELSYLAEMFDKINFPESSTLMQFKKFTSKKDVSRLRVAMDTKGLTFTMITYMQLVGVICFCVSLVEFINWLLMNNSIVSTFNTVEAYTLGIEAWNAYYA